MMKRGETVCEVHRAGRSRQGLAVQGCPRVGRRPRLLVLSRRRSRNGRGLRAGGAPGWDGVEFDQSEHYFVVRTSVQEISSDRWTEEERQVIVEHRWWTVDELRNASEPVFPEELTRLVESVSR